MKIKLVKPSHELIMIGNPTGMEILKHIEAAGRTCYKSEAKVTDESAEKFIKMIIKNSHESVLEHFSFSVRFICDRGVTHELVRHRMASYSQESTRYVGYGDIAEFIIPRWCENITPIEFNTSKDHYDYYSDEERIWVRSVVESADRYVDLLDKGWKPQQARSVLPNSLKTEIVMTTNLRDWRHIFSLRDALPAHPQIREIMHPLLTELHTKIPVVFDDIVGVG